MNNYILCILIPCFNNYDGVKRILNSVMHDERISVFLSDDSNEEYVSYKIKRYVAKLDSPRIRYLSGPRDGAVKNWNFLLEQVNADYYTLVHHDELLSSLDFVSVLKDTNHDVIVLPVKVIRDNGFRLISSRTQKVMNNFAGRFLPVFNFIGPTAALIISKKIKVNFDERLQWFVDAEWYFRIFSLSNFVKYLNDDSFVLSFLYENSITNTKFRSTNHITKTEKKLLLHDEYRDTIKNWNFHGFIWVRVLMYIVGFCDYFKFHFSKISAFLK